MAEESSFTYGTFEKTKLRGEFFISEIFSIIILLIIFFAISDRLDWVMAWVVLGLNVVCISIVSLAVSPSLIWERLKQTQKKEGTKKWDLMILAALAFFYFTAAFAAGFDARFGWSPRIPSSILVGASAVYAIGYALFYWAMASNRFFSNLVRIQGDRGQTVTSRGPYRFVRHPGYMGMILNLLALPMALGTLWALIPMSICALLLVERTRLEDRMLQDELAGYKEYARHVHYRLIPGIW